MSSQTIDLAEYQHAESYAPLAAILRQRPEAERIADASNLRRMPAMMAQTLLAANARIAKASDTVVDGLTLIGLPQLVAGAAE